MDLSEAQSHLLGVLAAHQIPLGDNDVSWAFSNPKTATPVVDWAEQYLGKDTLLSLEEAEIYNHLKKTGSVLKLQKQHPDLHLVRPRSEESLCAEIDALKASTEMLKKQTVQLKKQKANLQTMKVKGKAEEEKKRKLEERRRKKWLAEKENMQAAIDDLLGILREEVTDFKQNAKASAIDLEGVAKMLESDDRVLGRLGRLADGIIVSGGNEGTKEDAVVKRVTVLVRKLAMLSAAALKAQLDRLFLKMVSPETNTNDDSGPDADAIAELKRDLESLYSDIPSVAEMAAEQEYLQPVRKEVENGRRNAGEGLRVGGAYIRDVLLHLQKRNISAVERLKRELAKARAISQIIATIEQESKSPLTKPEEPPSTTHNRDRRRDSANIETPIKNSQPFKGMPVFTPPNRRRGTSLDLGRGDFKNGDDDFPELRMLTLLGIPMPSTPSPNASVLFASPIKGSPVAPSAPELPASKYKYLDSQVRKQSEKLQTQEKDNTAEAEIRRVMDEFWNVARIAEDALTGANMFPPLMKQRAHMSFVSEELVEGIEEVEKKVNSVASRMGGLSRGLEELERMGGDLQGQGREKKAFVDRWGRH